ncbi:MIP family channel protein (plasmid) [Gemmatirosa kalamazoonensis]|uniref:MIP family channel protein n=1 Tax=Gemmatirosa kalamazoonensis TaxID=861299 RepID=W0RPR2_9BACT|nr:MIP family channel protein [Gemmatirosa kalamazoonensis]AHG92325.1 MIP family channel protein [Gemmatirosa kalamazoonensis]
MTEIRVTQRRGWRGGVLGECCAEFLGTLVLIAFGTGVVATAVAALSQSGRGSAAFVAGGDWLLITFGWAAAVTLGAYVAGGVSGAHLNPALTVALALRRGFPWGKVLPYAVAQIAGAFAGAGLVYLNYADAIHAYEMSQGIVRGAASGAGTVGIFVTGPAPYYGGSFVGPVVDQIIGTAMLVLVIFALTDERNQPPKSNLAPAVVGLLVAAIGMSFGANAGYAINPARDFGPRLVTWLAGWGSAAFSGGGYWWVPIVGPLIGGPLGAYVYDFFVGGVLVARGEPPTRDVETGGRVVKEEPVVA